MQVWQKGGCMSANGETTNCVGREKEKKDKMHTKKCANAERRAEARAVVCAELFADAGAETESEERDFAIPRLKLHQNSAVKAL